ncbi:AraC family transcriptional regulator [uncultured Marivita sp.]|uniref:helix-turn-helix domain-containing protein n=1 Tax=uncultured Marivita sp. TaxID=888080 RepID=UPI00260F54F2|nr:AraC family transcriptional regulator [uncultured Marivita sp.]
MSEAQTNNGLLTAEQMVPFLLDLDTAIVHRMIGSDTGRIDGLVVTQGAELEPFEVAVEFGLLEFCLDGALHSENVMDGLATSSATPYRPGNFSFVPPGRTVRSHSITGEARLFQMLIDRSLMDEAKRAVLRGDPDRVDLLGFNAQWHPRMKALVGLVHEEMRRPSGGGALYVESLVQVLCVEIVRDYGTGRMAPEPAPGRLSPAQLSRAIEAIEAGLENNPGLETVARAAGVTTFHFARAFRATTGQTPHQYLIERRLARARELLALGDLPLAEIAYDCGFSSQAHMTTVFRKHMGVTPGQYRREVRG